MARKAPRIATRVKTQNEYINECLGGSKRKLGVSAGLGSTIHSTTVIVRLQAAARGIEHNSVRLGGRPWHVSQYGAATQDTIYTVRVC